jgi:uncharacterized protein with HEPN domain
MPRDDANESWRDAALLLDMKLAAEDALAFAAGLDERAFLSIGLHQSAVIRKLEVLGGASASRNRSAGRIYETGSKWRVQIARRRSANVTMRVVGSSGDGSNPRAA